MDRRNCVSNHTLGSLLVAAWRFAGDVPTTHPVSHYDLYKDQFPAISVIQSGTDLEPEQYRGTLLFSPGNNHCSRNLLVGANRS